jgi:predicted 3-demethylubiquinone-9 3-methyltransferase (glyoxalase superfamily)
VRIKPFIWYDNDVEEVVAYYARIFPDCRTISTLPGQDGKALLVTFELMGQELTAMNGGPAQRLSEAFSLVVAVDSQEEVDHLWTALTDDGGSPGPCGWLKDKFGLSWQITPNRLMELMSDPDREKADRVFQAMLQMHKIEIPALEAAYRGD